MKNLKNLFYYHWFSPLSILLVTVLVFFKVDINPKLITILLSIGLPLFYAACYRASKRMRLVLRCLMLMFFGLWIASSIIVDPTSDFAREIIWIRHLKWPLILYFEVQIIASIWRMVHTERKSVEEAYNTVLQEKGMPAWVTKLVGMEVRFWAFIGKVIFKKNRNVVKD